MSDTLMHRRKCLVIAGRKSTEPQIRDWMEESLRGVSENGRPVAGGSRGG